MKDYLVTMAAAACLSMIASSACLWLLWIFIRWWKPPTTRTSGTGTITIVTVNGTPLRGADERGGT